jgi:hypothetical protein
MTSAASSSSWMAKRPVPKRETWIAQAASMVSVAAASASR